MSVDCHIPGRTILRHCIALWTWPNKPRPASGSLQMGKIGLLFGFFTKGGGELVTAILLVVLPSCLGADVTEDLRATIFPAPHQIEMLGEPNPLQVSSATAFVDLPGDPGQLDLLAPLSHVAPGLKIIKRVPPKGTEPAEGCLWILTLRSDPRLAGVHRARDDRVELSGKEDYRLETFPRPGVLLKCSRADHAACSTAYRHSPNSLRGSKECCPMSASKMVRTLPCGWSTFKALTKGSAGAT